MISCSGPRSQIFSRKPAIKWTSNFTIYLISSKKRFSFRHSNSYQTGLSDHHNLIFSVWKPNLSNSQPKLGNYRDYKKFSFENFKTRLDNALQHCSTDYKHFNFFYLSLRSMLPLKKKVIRGNHKSDLNKELGEAIMLRTRLKNETNKSKSDIDMQPTRSCGIMKQKQLWNKNQNAITLITWM